MEVSVKPRLPVRGSTCQTDASPRVTMRLEAVRRILFPWRRGLLWQHDPWGPVVCRTIDCARERVPLRVKLAAVFWGGFETSHPTHASRGSLPVRLVLQRCIGVRRKLLVSIPVRMVTRLYTGFQDLPTALTRFVHVFWPVITITID